MGTGKIETASTFTAFVAFQTAFVAFQFLPRLVQSASLLLISSRIAGDQGENTAEEISLCSLALCGIIYDDGSMKKTTNETTEMWREKIEDDNCRVFFYRF
ncbi:unnamed protein product [Lactuca virosa]|uniref:Uncharacterized protein n=1 Tax=Lactuca virosa TaxID=75947 RepID=A0AAU9NT10_9ASTR|nr:unnamed protein product [Lactuca virosa]